MGEEIEIEVRRGDGGDEKDVQEVKIVVVLEAARATER